MAYDEQVAERMRKVLARRRSLSFAERKMFGGLAFLLNGNMCCGVVGKDIVLRLGSDGAERALEKRHVREMDFTGTPLSTMVYLAPAGYRSEEALAGWLKRAVDFTRKLPPKKKR